MKKAYYAIKKNLDYDTEEEMDRMMEDLEERVKKAEEEEKIKNCQYLLCHLLHQ